MPSAPAARRTPDSIEQFLVGRILEAQNALWWAELVRRVLGLVIAGLAGLLIWWVVDQWIWAPGVLGRTLLFVTVAVAAIAYGVVRLWPVMHLRVRPDYAARCLERDHPELGHTLSSYIGLISPPLETGDSATGIPPSRRTANPASTRGAGPQGLSDRVVQSIGAEAAGKLRLIDQPPSEATGLLPWWATTIGLIAVLAIYSAVSPKSILQSTARIFQPFSDLEAPQRVQITQVEPGNAEVLAGRTFQVSANVKHLRDQESVVFVWGDSETGDFTPTPNADASPDPATPANRVALSATTDGQLNRFAAEVEVPHHARGIQRYRIEAGDASAGPFELSIRDTPVVRIAAVHYEPPAYTGQKPRTRRTGDISGVEGTRVRIVAEINRPIVRAILELNPKLIGQEVRATAGASEMKITEDGSQAEHELVLRARGGNGSIALEDYRIRVWDDAEQSNADPVVYPIEVIEDLPPEITIVVPQRSPVDVPIDSVQRFEIHASDVDFGLSTVEVEVRRGIDLIARSVIWNANDRNASDRNASEMDREGKSGIRGDRVAENRVLGNQVIEYRFRPSRMITLGRGGRLNVGDAVEVVAIATDNRTFVDGAIQRPGDQSDAGVTRTKPVRLNLTMPENAGQAPPNEDPPKRQKPPQDGQSGGEGEGQQGEGQAGSGQGKGESGENQQGQGQPGEGQQGEGPPPDQPQNDDQQAQGQSGGQSSGPNPDDAMNPDSPEPNEPQENSDGSDSESGGPDSSGSDSSGSDSSGPDSSGTDSGGTGSADSQPQPGDNRGQNSEPKPGKNSGAADGQPGQSQQQNNPRPPQDDAEAFERIKEYLENQKKNNEPNPSNGNRENQEKGGPQDGNRQSTPQETSPQDQPSPQDQTGDDPQSGQPGGDPNASPDAQPPRGTTQPPENQNGPQPSGQESGGQESGGQESGDPSSANADTPPGSENDSQAENRSPAEASSGQENEPKTGQKPAEQDPTGQDSADQDPTGDQTSRSDSSDAAGSQADSAKPQESAKPQNAEQGEPQSQGSDEGQSGGQSDSKSSDSKQPSPKPSDSDSSSPSGNPQDGSSNSSPNNQSPTENNRGDGSQPGSDSQSGPQGDAPKNADASSASDPTDSEGGSSGSSGAGSGEDGTGEEAELPDPVDMEYTKKATDMVLDYLDETRQTPDPELLDRLKWSEQDLQKFRNRWKDARPQNQESSSDAKMSEDLREALQSLGMRPPNPTQATQRDQSDNLRGLRDSGNRREAPPSVRDAFEAFRRGLSQ